MGKPLGRAETVYARMMEVYAAYLEQTDYNVGRVVDAIEQTGQLDNTLVIYIVGDNGASAEGSMQGLLNELTFFNGVPEDIKQVLDAGGRHRHLEDLQPLSGRLGARDVHAVPVDQAGRQAFRRHAQRHGRLMAQADQGQGRAPFPVPPCDRHRPDAARGGGHRGAGFGQRRARKSRSKA